VEVDVTYSEPLSIIRFANTEERFEGIVPWNHESGNICQELPSDVEENEEEVECAQSKEGVDLGNRGLFLEVVQGRILG
jgi:hypothetical protein